MKKPRYLMAIVLTTALILTPASAMAAVYGGIGGQPANPRSNNPRTQSIFIYQLKPGQSATDGVKVLNNTNQKQTITLEAVDSELASGGNFTCKQATEKKTDVGSWIQLRSTDVTVPPTSSKVVPFAITVPNSGNIDVGEHDGCITIQAASQTASQETKNGVLLSFRSAIRVVVTIPGKIVKKLDIASVTVSPTKNDKYEVMPTFQNSGNVSLDTGLKVSLVSIFGAASNTVDEGNAPILPRTKATSSYELKHPFWGGLYRARVEASYNSNPNTQLGIDKNADLVTKTKDSALFLVAPAPLAGLIEGAILAVVIGAAVIFTRKHLHRKHVKRHWVVRTVEEGETLEKFAEAHHVSWKKIAKVNKLKAPYVLRKGQKLKLPPEKE
jgi:hypothetical protein